MQRSKLVVLVPDVETRERVRGVAYSHPTAGSLSFVIADAAVDVCVRELRRSEFAGSLLVITTNEADALSALSAGADEAFAAESIAITRASWAHLVARTALKSEARRQASERLASIAELERLCALGRLVSGVAEELSYPLSCALISLDLLKIELDPLYESLEHVRGLCAAGAPVPSSELERVLGRIRGSASTSSRAREVLEDVTETCESIAGVARDLEIDRYAQQEDAERHEFVDLRATMDGILRLFRRATAKSTHIERDYTDDLPEVLVPRARVAQVLTSLLANAMASVRKIQRDVHRVRVCMRADDAVVTVTVSDTGPGLAAEVLERLFDPLRSGLRGPSAEPRPLGLELAAARSIMRSLGGDLMIESIGGEGTTMVAWLPRPVQREARISQTVPKPDNQVRRLVLVVEPDGHVLSALSHLLGERYDVLLCLSGHEAKALVVSGARPDAIVAAVDDREGEQFLEWLLLERPDAARRLLVMTSEGELSDSLAALPKLDKPIEPAQLFRCIEERIIAPLRKTRALDELGHKLPKRVAR
jgi:signal transduction histidine kinase/CheY-like chemotaxis protein